MTDELRESKRQCKTYRHQTETDKKKIDALEKGKIAAEKQCYENQEVIKQLSEYAEEVLGKLKKDPANPSFKEMLYKKKKIDALISSKHISDKIAASKP